LTQGCADLGYNFAGKPIKIAGFTFAIALAEEMASRLGFPFCYTHPVTTGCGTDVDSAWKLVANSVHDFLRPQSVFRVTHIDQVWPPEHQAQLDDWKRRELHRATRIRKGDKIPALEIVVFDSKFMHPEARGIRWDLRSYWAARASGVDDPSLIVPLFGSAPPPSVFNHEGIKALTSVQDLPYPDRATPFDMLWGIDNGSKPLAHSFVCSNWHKAYQYYELGDVDIKEYEARDFITFSDFPGLPFTHCSVVAQNTVPKPGHDPELKRRRVLDHGYPRVPHSLGGRVYELLS
jgi:hypothetical protein